MKLFSSHKFILALAVTITLVVGFAPAASAKDDEEKVDYILADHEARITTSEDAIVNLGGAIDAEEVARTTADATLQSNIDAEEAARIAEDTKLQTQITTIVNLLNSILGQECPEGEVLSGFDPNGNPICIEPPPPPPVPLQIVDVQGPDAAIVDNLLATFDCTSLPSYINLIVTEEECEEIKEDLSLGLTGYGVYGTGAPGISLEMYVSEDCDPLTEMVEILSDEVSDSITHVLGSFSGILADFLLPILAQPLSNVIIQLDGNFSAPLVAPTSATVVSAGPSVDTSCSNSFALPTSGG